MSEDADRRELANITLSFLESAIHAILFSRGLYPSAIFERRQTFGITSWMCRHPEINAGIITTLESIKPLIMEGSGESFSLLILDPTKEIEESLLEEYRFDISLSVESPVVSTYHDMDSLLGAAISRILLDDSNLRKVNKDCTWRLVLRTHDIAVDTVVSGSDPHSPQPVLKRLPRGLTNGLPWIILSPSDSENSLTMKDYHQISCVIGGSLSINVGYLSC